MKIYKQLKDKKNVLLVKYEDLITKQEQVMQTVCSFLEIDFEDKMINFHKNKMSVANASTTDNWKNLNKKIMTHNSKKYKTGLNELQIQYIEYTCCLEMEYLGYKRDYGLLSDNQFKVVHEDLLSKERYEKPEYNFISEDEKKKRALWYDKLLNIQNQ